MNGPVVSILESLLVPTDPNVGSTALWTLDCFGREIVAANFALFVLAKHRGFETVTAIVAAKASKFRHDLCLLAQ